MRSKKGARDVVAIAVAGIMIAMSACTLLINNDRQCAQNTDCARFGAHLLCEQGVCVREPLPLGCVGGTPSQLTDFLNRCTTAEYDDTFDNCARLSLCGDAPPPPLVTPPVPPTGTPTSPGPTPVELCADPQKRPQVVFMNGSSNFIPLLQKVAPFMLASGVTPVFQQTNSCAGVRSVYGPLASQHVMKDPPSTGPGFYASYYPIDGSPPKPCLLGGNGVMTDIGESEIFASTCNIDKPAGDIVAEYFGPMATIVFAVNIASTDTAITAEAAREVFGIGDDPSNKATPWTKSKVFYIRNLNTATQQMVAHAIGVPADKFWGTDQGSASTVGQQLVLASDPARAIGIIGTDFYEKDPQNLKALAFRAQGQSVAYLPDSSAKARDKRNVRDGHYPIWGPLHFFTKLPLAPNVAAFLQVVAPASLKEEVLMNYISSSLVPDCAMMVHRDSELEELTTYNPPVPCNCFFEANVPGGAIPRGCQACTDNNACPDAKTCNVGFCE